MEMHSEQLHDLLAKIVKAINTHEQKLDLLAANTLMMIGKVEKIEKAKLHFGLN